MNAKPKDHPTGWASPNGGRSLDHWFGADGSSLCGKYRNHTYNILSRDEDVHPSNRCKVCDGKRAKAK